MNETLDTVDGRAVLRMERRLAHPPDEVWRALTDPVELSRWFPATVAMDLAIGTAISFDFGDGPSPGGEIIELDPPGSSRSAGTRACCASSCARTGKARS